MINDHHSSSNASISDVSRRLLLLTLTTLMFPSILAPSLFGAGAKAVRAALLPFVVKPTFSPRGAAGGSRASSSPISSKPCMCIDSFAAPAFVPALAPESLSGALRSREAAAAAAAAAVAELSGADSDADAEARGGTPVCSAARRMGLISTSITSPAPSPLLLPPWGSGFRAPPWEALAFPSPSRC